MYMWLLRLKKKEKKEKRGRNMWSIFFFVRDMIIYQNYFYEWYDIDRII